MTQVKRQTVEKMSIGEPTTKANCHRQAIGLTKKCVHKVMTTTMSQPKKVIETSMAFNTLP